MNPSEIYKKHILHLYRTPHNYGKLKNATNEYKAYNPVCGDDLTIQLIIKNKKIDDIRFSGNGCAISVASASLLTDKAKGMSTADVKKLTKEDMLKLLQVPIGPGREKCALLCLEGLQKSIESSPMVNHDLKEVLEKQQYRIIGSHSAVKICSWTKKMIKDEGSCYKHTFYGIRSNQCLQMTSSLSCASRCVFCWRDYKCPVSREWKWDIDDPGEIVDTSFHAQHELLVGLKGFEKTNMDLYHESEHVKHAAISLIGEPIMYPKINELIEEFDKRAISTFLVTNGQYPEQIRELMPVTQLYISVDAPNKKIMKEIDLPLFPDYWERLNESLKQMSQKKQRTCIRLTCIKGMNMTEPEQYAKLITKADPNYIEVKAYMFVGASRQKLSIKNMPLHQEIVEFAKDLNLHLDNYEVVAEHIPSRVVLLAKRYYKKNGKWHTWIDFKKYNQLVTSQNQDFTTQDYLKLTPSKYLGISGKGTKKKTKKGYNGINTTT